jgi:MDMPI C-terminal domain
MAAPSPLAFWARRQAHETAIHRADADIAAAVTPAYPAEFAADGIDELITGFGARRKYQPQLQPQSQSRQQPSPSVDDRLLRVVTTDTADAWSIEIHPGHLRPHRETRADAAAVAGSPDGSAFSDGAACTVTGPASGLYLYLWNRVSAAEADIAITGDPALLASWQSAVKVRWD